MANKKTRNQRYVTDKGTAIFPYLVEPDTKYNADGEYKVKLRLSPDATLKGAKGRSVGSIQEFLDTKLEESVAKAKKENPKVRRLREADAPYEIDEDTGDILINFKLKALVKTRDGREFEQQPALFDAKGKPTTPDEVWGGSTIKVSFEVIPFYTKLIGAGISLRMKAVQIIELIKGGQADADSYGFGEEEGSYEEDAHEEGSEFTDEESDTEEAQDTDDEEEEDDDEEGDF